MKIILFICFACLGRVTLAQEKQVHLSGNLSFLNDGDTVILRVHQYAGFYYYKPFRRDYTCASKDHDFEFNVPCAGGPQYIDLEFKGKENLNLNKYLVLPGDHVVITREKDDYQFHGPSAEQFHIQQQLRDTGLGYQRAMSYKFNPQTYAANISGYDSCAKQCLAILEKKRLQLPDQFCRILKTDVVAGLAWSVNYPLDINTTTYTDSTDNPYQKPLVDFDKRFDADLRYRLTDSAAKINSFIYGESIYERYLIDSCQFRHRRFSVEKCYQYEKEHFSGILREQLVTLLLYSKRNTSQDITAGVADALTYVQNPDFRALLMQLKSNNSVGVPAYNFVLKDEKDHLVRLSDFRGKLVIVDFWFTGCGNCRDLAPLLFQVEKDFAGKKVVFVSINIDKSKTQWQASLNGGLYSSAYSTNLNTGGVQDPVIGHYEISAYPTLLLIDQQGHLGPVPGDPRLDNGKNIREVLNRYLNQ